MMERLREGVNSIAVKIILGIIILSFVFAGIGSYLVSGHHQTVAKVGNVEISRSDFEKVYQNERNQRMQSQNGKEFSRMLGEPSFVAMFRKSVLDRMINDALLEDKAHSLGMRISDKQVAKAIVDFPMFQVDGKFDKTRYNQLLPRLGYTPDSFAKYIRTELLRSQLLTALQGTEFALPKEAESESRLYTQTRDIRTATIDIAKFAQNVTLKDDEIAKYYKTHSTQFTRPEQMKIAYIEVDAKKLADKVSVTTAEEKKYYQDNLDKYTNKEQRHLSHILIKGNDKNAQQKAEDILKKLQAGADFAKLAKEDSQDVGSASKGGDLGWVEPGTMVPAFDKAAFALKKAGDLSEVVKSSFGYHIIKLDAVKAAAPQPFADVEKDVKQAVADQKAVNKFYDLQKKLQQVAFESPDSLDDAAKAVNLPVHTTDFVAINALPKVLQTQSVVQALNSDEVKNQGVNSSAIEVSPEHIVVVRINDIRPATVLPLKEVKDKVVAALSQQKGEQEAQTVAKQVLKSLREGKKDELKAHDLAFDKHATIDRSSLLAPTVYAMPKPKDGKTVYGQSKDDNGNIVLIALDKVTDKLDPRVTKIVQQRMASTASQQDLASILAVLRKNTDIEYHDLGNGAQ